MANQGRQTGRGGAGMGPNPDPAGKGDDSGANPGVGETGVPLPTGDKPDPRGGTIVPDFEDITEPTGDANFPDPSKPISVESGAVRGSVLTGDGPIRD